MRRVMLPAALGAGLALGAGCGDRSAPSPDGKVADAGVDHQQVADTSTPADQQVKLDKQIADTYVPWDFYPPPPYMAPDAAPLYRSLG